MLETGTSAESNNYRGYLVRIWRSSAQSPWRASIRDTHTGEQRHFAQLEALYCFLDEETTDHWPHENQNPSG